MPPEEDAAAPTPLKPIFKPGTFFTAHHPGGLSEDGRKNLKAEVEAQLGVPVVVLCEGVTLTRYDAT